MLEIWHEFVILSELMDRRQVRLALSETLDCAHGEDRAPPKREELLGVGIG